MNDVRIGFIDHQLVDIDAAVIANTSQVVALQVHQHDMLGALFGVEVEFLPEVVVLAKVGATAARAGNWAGLGLTALQLDQPFR